MTGSSLDLSCIIVNYGAADYVGPCAESILRQRMFCDEGRGVEVIVVDNFVSDDEREKLRRIETDSVRLLLLEENLGYAGGLVKGLEVARGERICFLNPDIQFLPGSLKTLCDFLDSSPDIGAVTPRSLLDEEGVLLHPPHRLPGLRELALTIAARRSRRLSRRLDRSRTAFALRYWDATVPQDAEMLTGCCLLTTRAVLSLVGPPDPAYPLYFEDSDWCRRVRAASLRLIYHPGAELIHFYSVSANQGLDVALQKYGRSRELYFRKFYGRLGRAAARWLLAWTEGSARSESSTDFHELGEFGSPPKVELVRPSGRPVLVEMAGLPTFDLAVGGLTKGEIFGVSATTWRHMYPTRYYFRCVDPVTLEILGAWTFTKQSLENPTGLAEVQSDFE